MKTADAAQGQWFEILLHFGIPKTFLGITSQGGPCPLCEEGDDRYQFKDYGQGIYFCRRCPDDGRLAKGNGFTMLRYYKGWTFREAASRIDSYLGGHIEKYAPKPVTAAVKLPKQKPRPTIENSANTTKHILSIMNCGWPIKEGDDAAGYLTSRGLWLESDDLFFSENLYDGESKRKWPAMVGVVSNTDGKVIALSRLFLLFGAKAPIMVPRKFLGAVKGGSVRLSKVGEDGHLGIAEGIETAIAAQMIFRVPVWAVLSADALRNFELPEGVSSITIFADNDENKVGQLRAMALERRLRLAGVPVTVLIPPKRGDWNDALLKKYKDERGAKLFPKNFVRL